MKAKASLCGKIAALLLSLASPAFAVTHYVDVNGTNATPPFLDWSTVATNIQDGVNVAATNEEVVVASGTYFGRVGASALRLRSVSGPKLTIINGGGTNNCVSLARGASLTGFTITNGSTGNDGGGVWSTVLGGILTNCVLSGNSASEGGGAYGCILYDCVLTGNSARNLGGGAMFCTLYNCTLTGNASAWLGGGAEGCTLYNCTLNTNTASSIGGGAHVCALYNCSLSGNFAGYQFYQGVGGGASGCRLFNCTLTGNAAALFGGGASSDNMGIGPDPSAVSWLHNCTLIGNTALRGGGVSGSKYDPCTLYNCTLISNSAALNGGGSYGGTLYNCIVYSNTATNGTNYDSNGLSSLSYCCTTPLPTNGIGNITSEPFFVDTGKGNLRLQSNSPCINAGNNSNLTNSEYDYLNNQTVWFTNSFDLDGNPRVISGTVDIGAYEFQGSGSRISYAWLQQYGWPTDGSADFLDPDGDVMNNWQEWRCLTIPADPVSVLKLLAPIQGASGVTVRWRSVPNRSYWLERAANFALPLAFSSIASNLAGQEVTTTFTDTNAVGPGTFFYRVGVQP